jgi:voltage-gated potassium channel
VAAERTVSEVARAHLPRCDDAGPLARREIDVNTETPRPNFRNPESRRAIQQAIGRALLWVVGILVLYFVLPLDPHDDGSAIVRVVVGSAVLVGVVGYQTLAVVRSSHRRARAIDALASCVIVIVVVFALAYLNMSARDPAAFNETLNRTSALYFTVVTLATIGYGDIVARTDMARTVVMMQVVVNIVILGSAIKVIAELARRAGPPGRRRGD